MLVALLALLPTPAFGKSTYSLSAYEETTGLGDATAVAIGDVTGDGARADGVWVRRDGHSQPPAADRRPDRSPRQTCALRNARIRPRASCSAIPPGRTSKPWSA